MPDDPSINRRRFFREGLRELLKGVAKAAEPIERAIGEFDRRTAAEDAARVEPFAERSNPRDGSAGALPSTGDFHSRLPGLSLRPPGALPEQQFTDTCTRCGRCVEVCPAQCIRIDVAGKRGGGAPYIDADVSPCVVCDSLACMNACPSGALSPVPLVEIDMGAAVWRAEHCIRTRDEECRLCAEKCPMGTAAIDVVGKAIVINPLGCVGCGVCQHYCPTSPKSIVVIPAAAKSA